VRRLPTGIGTLTVLSSAQGRAAGDGCDVLVATEKQDCCDSRGHASSAQPARCPRNAGIDRGREAAVYAYAGQVDAVAAFTKHQQPRPEL
jgi:hypothetical protein